MKAVGTVARYWHTLRHLRPEQLYGRMLSRFMRSRPDLSPPPTVRATVGPWVLPAQREPSMTGQGAFRFLAVERNLDDVGWDDLSIEKLWRYNLHYFDDLNATGARERAGWHRENTPGHGTGWEPYPTSLRIVNWIKFAVRGGDLDDEAVGGQARGPEYHLPCPVVGARADALSFHLQESTTSECYEAGFSGSG